MRKLFFQLHKWLSIPVGLIIAVICFSGAMLVFQDEIQEAAHPERYFVEQGQKRPLSLDKLIPMVNSRLKDNKVKDVKIPADPKRTYALGLAEGFRTTAFVNQYTGEITGIYAYRDSPFFVIMSLHRWMLDDTRTWGKYTVGISTLLFAFILVTGFVIWFPKKMKRNKFTVEFKKGRKRLFFDLHNVLGAYACLVLFISAITGLMWSFDWYRNGVFKLFGAEIPKEEPHKQERKMEMKKGEENAPPFALWQGIADGLAAQNPNYEYLRIQNGSAVVHQKNAPTSRATDKYEFDAKTGGITKVTLYKDQEKSSRIWGWVYDLHVGNYWGMFSKIFTFIFAIIGGSLPLTGYYIWFVKINGKKKKRTTELKIAG